MLRVNGTAEFVNDKELEKRFMKNARGVLANKSVMPDTEVFIFRIHKGTCHFWDMSSNGKESAAPRVTF